MACDEMLDEVQMELPHLQVHMDFQVQHSLAQEYLPILILIAIAGGGRVQGAHEQEQAWQGGGHILGDLSGRGRACWSDCWYNRYCTGLHVTHYKLPTAHCTLHSLHSSPTRTVTRTRSSRKCQKRPQHQEGRDRERQ